MLKIKLFFEHHVTKQLARKVSPIVRKKSSGVEVRPLLWWSLTLSEFPTLVSDMLHGQYMLVIKILLFIHDEFRTVPLAHKNRKLVWTNSYVHIHSVLVILNMYNNWGFMWNRNCQLLPPSSQALNFISVNKQLSIWNMKLDINKETSEFLTSPRRIDPLSIHWRS